MASRYLTDKWPIVDDMTNIAVGIDSVHHEVHEGSSFQLMYANTAMAKDDYIGIAFSVPQVGTKRLHLLPIFSAAAAAHIELIISPTLVSGISFTPINRFVGHPNTSMVTDAKYYDSQVGTDALTGTSVVEKYSWGTKQGGGSESRALNEVILSGGLTYGIKLVADVGSNGGQLTLSWYEHTDSNA